MAKWVKCSPSLRKRVFQKSVCVGGESIVRVDIYSCAHTPLDVKPECVDQLHAGGGAVAIVTPPGVYPTSVGSARVEDHAGSRGVWQNRRTAAQSAVGGEWYSLAGPVIITPNTEQQRGVGRSRQNPNGEKGWVGVWGARKQSKGRSGC